MPIVSDPTRQPRRRVYGSKAFDADMAHSNAARTENDAAAAIDFAAYAANGAHVPIHDAIDAHTDARQKAAYRALGLTFTRRPRCQPGGRT